MKKILFSLALLAGLAGGSALYGQDTFRVRVAQPPHGRVTVTPAVPESGVVPAGTVLFTDHFGSGSSGAASMSKSPTCWLPA